MHPVKQQELFHCLPGGDHGCGGGENTICDDQTVLGGVGVRLEGGHDRAERVLRGQINRIQEVGLVLGQARVETDGQEAAAELADTMGLLGGAHHAVCPSP